MILKYDNTVRQMSYRISEEVEGLQEFWTRQHIRKDIKVKVEKVIWEVGRINDSTWRIIKLFT
jgi:hypothetical protein